MRLIVLVFLTITISSCPNSDERCGSCQGSTCEFCYDSYISSSGKCTEATQKIENCLTYGEEGKTCKQCVFKYVLKDNTCVAIDIDGCLRVDENGSCLSCQDGSTLNGGKCTSDKKCAIPDCKHCGFDNGKEICIFCNSGFAIFPTDDKNQCKSTGLSGCLALNFYDEEQCSLCKAGYFFKDGKCSGTSVYKVNMENEFILHLFYSAFLFLLI